MRLGMIGAMLAIACMGLTGTGVLAADLPAVAAVPEAAAPEVFDWTGLYVGAQVGVIRVNGVTDAPFNYADFSNGNGGLNRYTASPRWTGFTGGVNLGFDQQLGSVVLGGVGDINFDGGSGNAGYYYYDNAHGGAGSGPTNNGENADFSLNWDGSVRAKIGVPLDNFMPYITGGVAFGQANFTEHRTFGSGTYTGTANLLGYTLGAGLSYAVTDQIIVTGEYRHTNYNSVLSGSIGANAQDTNDSYISASSDRATLGVSFKF